jgi:hypothetical protein
MNKEDIHKASIGNPCDANWQVEDIKGVACYISCRACGTVLQSGCTPKCLKSETISTESVKAIGWHFNLKR